MNLWADATRESSVRRERWFYAHVASVNNGCSITNFYIKSLSSKSYLIFENLVRNAEIITVAEEPDCVDLLKTEPDLTSGILKEKLLLLFEHILEKGDV